MALLKFLRGTQGNLANQTIVDGALYFTTDTHRIMMGTASGLQEYSAIEVVTGIAALPAVASAIPGKFYYAESENVFCFVHNGSWQQVNPDTGATSIEVVGAGNAVTAASYDATTRKLTLTKGETFATKAELDTLDTFVGDIPEGYTETNVIAYINKKAEETLNAASGGSSESAASVLGALNTYKASNDARVEAVEKEVDDLQTAIAEGGSVATAIAAAQAAADQAQKEVDELETVVADYKTANDAAVAKKADAENVYTKTEIDGKVSTLENADLAINNKIGTVAEGKTVVGLIEDAQAKADAAYVKPADGIGTDDLHADVVASLAKADSALQAADIENKADKATTLDGYGITDAYTKDEVDTAVNAKVAQSEYDTKIGELVDEDEKLAGLINENAAAIEEMGGEIDILVGEDTGKSVRAIANEELAAQLIGENAKDSLDTLQEIAAWIQEHPEDASAMNAAIDALETKVDTGNQTVSAYVAAAVAALNIGDYALAADLTALAGRVEDLEAASETHALKTEVNAVSDSLTEYKNAHIGDYDNDAIDAKVEGIQDQIDALGDTYATDKELTDAIAAEVERANGAYAGKAYEATVDGHVADAVKHITADERTAWNGAQAAAEATAAAALATARTEITAEIATAKGEAISDAEGKIATAIENAKIDASNKDAVVLAEAQKGIAAAKSELQGNIDNVSDALNTYKTENNSAVALKANAADVYNKAEVENMLTWGEF